MVEGTTEDRPHEIARRQEWMAVLAKAKADELAELARPIEQEVSWRFIRAPEIGMTMIRARAGGDGQRFNLGEATLTRCSVEAERRWIGHAYVLGRDRRHAALAALLDALLQDPERQPAIEARILEPLRRGAAERAALASRKAAATKVEFFTLVRGEDE
jgi:alpha-D-ribose 1-methylphosphonate 5-triphosphate synthase subunit PhnG